MAPVRHRRRVRLTRFVAAVAPLAAVALAGAAFVFQDQWLPAAAAAAAGAVLSLVLAVMLLRLDRRWRLEVAMARAAQAAEYAAEHERYSSEHRSFTSHMIGLLDAASDRLGVQRRRIEALEAEVTGLRVARPAAADTTPALATFAEGPEWNEQAAEYAAEHERYSSEHRSFTSHMIGLLDAASVRLGVQRRRIEALEAEVSGLRVAARPAPADPSPALATLTEGPEWNELWPDLADAPTVVDLLKWDERMQHGLLPDADADDHRGERTA